MTNDRSQASAASSQMLQMLNAVLTVQGLYVAADLGIADRLASSAHSAVDLAAETGVQERALGRLLRMLAAAGVFREEPDGRFALTPLGECLRSERPDSVRDWALFVGSPQMWEVFGQLRETVATGQAAFPRLHGVPLWDYLAEHPDLGAPFHRWMSRQSAQHNAAIVAAYDFSAFHTVADIGGGQGSTLAAIMQANPALRGVLLDLPRVVANTGPLDEAGVTHRCTVVGGDMLQDVPEGADIYLVKRVLMDWGDEQAATILRRCAAAMPDDGKMLAVEMVLPAGNDPSPGKVFDVLMLLAHPGARIRTESEFGELFATAGLRLTRVIPTASPNSILEAARA